jgi:GNAT superfamily N-acetyltransferase
MSCRNDAHQRPTHHETGMRLTAEASARPVLIRQYRDTDKDEVRRLFIRINRQLAPEGMREAFEDYIEQSLREEIERIPAYYGERCGSFWIAEEAGALVGMYGLERIGPASAELRRMYVAPEAQRRGIARAMLDHAEHTCREAGLETLILSTSELQAALALYRASGFRLVREEVASTRTNKAVGSGLRRFHFEKQLTG